MKKLILLSFLLISISSFSQVDKLITDENVSRVIKTLSSDAMMGRPAVDPQKMEPSIAFIESEFKKIGLKPLKGLKNYRQEFQKEKVRLENAVVTIDGETVSPDNTLILSDKENINASGLPVKTIAYDSTVTNKAQYFFGKAVSFARDTTSGLMLIAPEFEASFRELKGYFSGRFTNKRTSIKVFVLGKTSASSFTVKATQKLEVIKMTNVTGMLEGNTKPEEMVVFSGHYDHLGILQPLNGDSIANGADDDASGTTAVIELARYFKKTNKNNRTLIFVAFTAEEIGGYGSKYFSEQLVPEKVVAMFNIEMIGKASKWGQNSAFVTGYERSDFGAILEKNLAGTAFSFKADPYPDQNLFYRSDNATLARLGVPAHTISTDQIDIDKFYHTVDDEFETMDIKNIVATIRAIALSAKSIVDGSDTPKRIDKATVN